MMQKDEILLLIQQQGILPLFYHDDIDVCTSVLHTLYKAGIRAVEFTNRGANATANFKQISSLAAQYWQGLQLGIGTVLNATDATNFIDAGARFIVCPGVIPEVADIAREAGLLWVPGCMTPTEIIVAKSNGAQLVKIFPGSLVGASYITAIKDVFSDMLFMPTGGVEVSEANIGAWFKAGVCAVGLGSKVISKNALAQRDYAGIEQSIREAIAIVKKVRQQY